MHIPPPQIFKPEAAVFIHRGLPSYLLCSLTQAHLSSPGLRIILIGDRNPKLPFVEWTGIESLSSSWGEIEKAYVHLSTNPEPFERFCFYRWFALREAMRRLDLRNVIHLDSDVMLYFDPLAEPPDAAGAELAFGSSGSTSGHFAWIGSPNALDTVCTTMLDLFRIPGHLEELRSHFDRQAPFGGGVCDMYALGWLVRNRVVPVHELNEVRSNSVFDYAIGDSRTAGKIETWRMREGRKTIHWDEGKPHFETLQGERVRAMTIHFQGGHKNLMFRNMPARPFRFRTRHFFSRLRERRAHWMNLFGVYKRHVMRGLSKRIRRVFGKSGSSRSR